MADQPAEVDEQVVLMEQVSRVSSATSQHFPARRQPASSLNGVLVFSRQKRQLILSETEREREKFTSNVFFGFSKEVNHLDTTAENFKCGKKKKTSSTVEC